MAHREQVAAALAGSIRTYTGHRWRLEAVLDRIDAKIAGFQRAKRNTVGILEDCRAGRCRLVPDA